MTPGSRQTIADALHPELGEGRLVCDNGPTFFMPDAGECVAYRNGVGYRSENTETGRASFLIVTTEDGKRVELETTGCKCSPTHTRVETIDKRVGWLVTWFPEPFRVCYRFEPDGGTPEEFEMQSSKCWYSWNVMTRRDGKEFVYKPIKEKKEGVK